MLLGGVPGVSPARSWCSGGAWSAATPHAWRLGLGADVTIIDRSIPRLRELDECSRVGRPAGSAVEEEIATADAVIGAVLVTGATAPRLVTREMLKLMKPGAVLVDVAIDQGGCFETAEPTTHDDPTYEVDGIIHYCVANMPGAVPLTSSHALNNATLPYGLALADKGMDAFKDPHLRAELNIHAGKVMHRAVAESLGLPFDQSLSR